MYYRIIDRAKELGYSKKELIEEYDKRFVDKEDIDKEKHSIERRLNDWRDKGKKANPGITSLKNLSSILDCDIDYLAGLQDVPRKSVDALVKQSGFSYKAMETMAGIAATDPEFAKIINDFFMEIDEDDKGNEYFKGSDLVFGIRELCTLDIAPSSVAYNLTFNNPYGRNYWALVYPSDILKIKQQQLYDKLFEFITEQRAKRGLTYILNNEEG